MQGRIHELPPSKRFKLLHQKHVEEQFLLEVNLPPECLPAKKRRDCNQPFTPICLPAKKRVWVPHPLFHLEERDTHQPTETPCETGVDLEDGDDDGVLCAVCHSTDGDPLDPIVFCDGCDLMVHSSCYGNPLILSIPDGDWFCMRCQSEMAEEKGDFDCFLCPQKGGAVKPTSDNSKWAHILCALLVPEVFFRDPEGREGIDCSRVPEKRKGVECYLCRSKRGCGIECSQPKCALAFHVSCGLEKGLSIELKEANGVGIVAAFCEDHTQLWKKQELTGKFKIVPREKVCSDSKIRG